MTFSNKILSFLSNKILRKNERFKNLHSGESCYIFGNGASLKYLDLRKFNDRISIGCNSLFFHSDMHELNLKYYYMGHPFLFYKYWKNHYKNKYQKNLLGHLYQKKIQFDSRIEYFVSLSNYFGIKGKNINYLHHFDQCFSDFESVDLSCSFSTMDGALDGMLGMAIYMGFKDIILVGCDYLSSPVKPGHFFEYGDWGDIHVEKIHKEELLLPAKKEADIKILTVNNKYSSDIFTCISYQELTNEQPQYKENTQLVLACDLMQLNNTDMRYKIFKEC